MQEQDWNEECEWKQLRYLMNIAYQEWLVYGKLRNQPEPWLEVCLLNNPNYFEEESMNREKHLIDERKTYILFGNLISELKNRKKIDKTDFCGLKFQQSTGCHYFEGFDEINNVRISDLFLFRIPSTAKTIRSSFFETIMIDPIQSLSNNLFVHPESKLFDKCTSSTSNVYFKMNYSNENLLNRGLKLKIILELLLVYFPKDFLDIVVLYIANDFLWYTNIDVTKQPKLFIMFDHFGYIE